MKILRDGDLLPSSKGQACQGQQHWRDQRPRQQFQYGRRPLLPEPGEQSGHALLQCHPIQDGCDSKQQGHAGAHPGVVAIPFLRDFFEGSLDIAQVGKPGEKRDQGQQYRDVDPGYAPEFAAEYLRLGEALVRLILHDGDVLAEQFDRC